jgi:oligopeptide/dipeptide ABC transporter ATP-binding protein
MTQITHHTLIAVDHLSVVFNQGLSSVPVVNDVSFELHAGEILGLVGESGSGKSTIALALLAMVPRGGHVSTGSVWFEGRDLLMECTSRDLASIRGSKMSMIFQNPATHLNPLHRVGHQLMETLQVHEDIKDERAKERVIDMLRQVDLPDPESTFLAYPHELSGGMKQRAMIALALITHPRVLIADEPTTGLDATLRLHMLRLLESIGRNHERGMLFITHDLAAVSQIATRTMVLLAGQIVETLPTSALNKPCHPYTKALASPLQITPVPHHVSGNLDIAEPAPSTLCGFVHACPKRMPVCEALMPELTDLGPNHRVRCWLYPPQGANYP